LDNRRLNAQHSEVHIAITCLGNIAAGKPASGWSNPNNAQLRQWVGKRGALYRYHNDIIIPECRSRWPRSDAYDTHDLFDVSELPKEEQDHRFWPNVTWDQVLLDCRHLIEKHNNDKEMVRLCQEHGVRRRVVPPRGHSARAILFTFWRAISHVYNVPLTDSETIQRIAIRLTRQKLLDPPRLEIAA